MEPYKILREEDRVNDHQEGGAAGRVDLSPLVGAWVNTNDKTIGIQKVVTLLRDNNLSVRVYGASPDGPSDWGEVEAESVYSNGAGSCEGFAFSARYDFGFMEIHLQANLSLGLLVVAGLNRFKDGSRRSNYFSREFFYHTDGPTSEGQLSDGLKIEMGYAKEEDRARVEDKSVIGSIDASPFVGVWATTNRSSEGIVRIEVREANDGILVRAFGACSPEPCDWGSVRGELFSDGAGSHKGLALSAVYSFDFIDVHLQAKVKKGVLVVAAFNEFKDRTPRSNYFSREFFYMLRD